jgi:hypothetical protein
MRPTVPGRLRAQALVGAPLADPLDVVRHLGAVQAQLADMACWGIARRTSSTTLADVHALLDGGDLVRTHVLRPTWHLLAPDDVHWLQALTGPRVARLLETTNRSIGLTPEMVEQGVAVVVEALAAPEPPTRSDLARTLSDAGLALSGQGVAHVVMAAETRALVASGPLRGRQHTYRLLAPRAVDRTRDELLADVARRYVRGHGPIREHDLAWWTSLTLTDSRRAIELGGLRPLDVEGVIHWTLDDPGHDDLAVPRVMLLPNFDEYVSYARDPSDYAGIDGAVDDVMRATGLLFVDGRLAGSWTRSISSRRVVVEVGTDRRVTAVLRRALQDEADAFGRFLGREAELRLPDRGRG